MNKAALALCCISLLSLPVSAATSPDAMALMKQVDQGNRPAFEKVTMKMEVRGSGDPLVRDLTWHFTNAPAKRTSLLKFNAPANVQGSGTLVVEQQGEDNAIWHYQPSTRNVRRISSQHRQNRFMGTDFVFEDFEGLKLDKYRFSLLRKEPCGNAGGSCEVVEAVATDKSEKAGSSYSKKLFWVDAEKHVITRTELYGADGKLAKTYESTGFRKLGSHWRPQVQEMRTADGSHSTRITEVDRSLDQPFDAYYVSQQYLRSD